MDGFSIASEAPLEYHKVKWISDLFILGMGAGWVSHYVLMINTSIRDRTYCLNIMALCSDVAWEFVYSVVYPSANPIEWWVIFGGMLVNIFVMYTATLAAPNDWKHSPLVVQNAGTIFIITTAFWIGNHFAVAAQLGPGLAYSWGAITCQMLVSAGQVCQLLSRNNTRGASYKLWLTRFLGSICTVGFATVRYIYWPEVFSWLGSPVVIWALSVFFFSEFSYGYCLYRLKGQEAALQWTENKRK